VRRHRRSAAAAQGKQELPFGGDGLPGGGILQRGEQSEGGGIVRTALYGQGALPGGRQHHIQRQPLGNIFAQAQAR
jgi:hypothetical protein